MAMGNSLRILLNGKMLRLLVPMLMKGFRQGAEANKLSSALGKKYNVPPLGAMSLLNALGDITISYSSSYFTPYSSTLPATIHFSGWTVNDTPSKEAFPFEQLQGRRLIYISLGTVINDNATFFKTCIEAFTGSDDYVIISTGNRISPEAFGVLPENIAVYSWVPQIEVLKRAALFIT